MLHQHQPPRLVIRVDAVLLGLRQVLQLGGQGVAQTIDLRGFEKEFVEEHLFLQAVRELSP